MSNLLLIVLSVTSTAFAFLFVIQRKKNVAILANTLQLLVMQEVEQEKNKSDREKSNEDFLKFVSDSRDWAYEYIEEVQKSLNNFITDIKPEIDYFDKYGEVGSAYPHYHSMKKISVAYKELKKMLPEDYDRIE